MFIVVGKHFTHYRDVTLASELWWGLCSVLTTGKDLYRATAALTWPRFHGLVVERATFRQSRGTENLFWPGPPPDYVYQEPEAVTCVYLVLSFHYAFHVDITYYFYHLLCWFMNLYVYMFFINGCWFYWIIFQHTVIREEQSLVRCFKMQCSGHWYSTALKCRTCTTQKFINPIIILAIGKHKILTKCTMGEKRGVLNALWINVIFGRLS